MYTHTHTHTHTHTYIYIYIYIFFFFFFFFFFFLNFAYHKWWHKSQSFKPEKNSTKLEVALYGRPKIQIFTTGGPFALQLCIINFRIDLTGPYCIILSYLQKIFSFTELTTRN